MQCSAQALHNTDWRIAVQQDKSGSSACVCPSGCCLTADGRAPCLLHAGCCAAGAIGTPEGVTVLAANQFFNNTAASHGAVAYKDGSFTICDTSGVVRKAFAQHVFIAIVCDTFLDAWSQCSVGRLRQAAMTAYA